MDNRSINNFSQVSNQVFIDLPIGKENQDPPAAPTLFSSDINSITLNAIAGAEYNIDGGAWQDSPIFSGLTESVEYTFTARLKATLTHFASPASDPSIISATLHAIIYSTPGADTFTVPAGITAIDIAVIAGGGGAGSADGRSPTYFAYTGGCGGAGGVIYIENYPVTPGSVIPLYVGSHGIGGAAWNVSGTNGENSTFGSGGSILTAIGGGGGGRGRALGASPGADGGSGGGGGTDSSGSLGGNATQTDASGYPGSGYGNDGGDGNINPNYTYQGGGGGASGPGSASAGGLGIEIFGSTYATGGLPRPSTTWTPGDANLTIDEPGNGGDGSKIYGMDGRDGAIAIHIPTI